MKPRVYLETTIPSLLTAWPSRDLIVAADQQSTRDWWETRRQDFELFVSPEVLGEAGQGDPSGSPSPAGGNRHFAGAGGHAGGRGPYPCHPLPPA